MKLGKNPNTPHKWDCLLFGADGETAVNSPYYRKKISNIYNYLSKKQGKLLDIGFGAGHIEAIMQKNNLNFRYYGLDFSKKAVSNAKKNLKGDFRLAKADKIPFRNHFFDFVLMLDVIEHIHKGKAKGVLKEIKRVLKKEGVLIVSVPVNENLKELNRLKLNKALHVREYTPESIKKELIEAGFTIENQQLIVAFKNFFALKTLIWRIFPNFRKPNISIVYTRKV